MTILRQFCDNFAIVLRECRNLQQKIANRWDRLTAMLLCGQTCIRFSTVLRQSSDDFVTVLCKTVAKLVQNCRKIVAKLSSKILINYGLLGATTSLKKKLSLICRGGWHSAGGIRTSYRGLRSNLVWQFRVSFCHILAEEPKTVIKLSLLEPPPSGKTVAKLSLKRPNCALLAVRGGFHLGDT